MQLLNGVIKDGRICDSDFKRAIFLRFGGLYLRDYRK